MKALGHQQRRYLHIVYVLSLLSCLPILGGAGVTAAAGCTSETLVYKNVGDRKLHLYVERPAALKPTDRLPAIVFFFGGGWVDGKPTQFQNQSECHKESSPAHNITSNAPPAVVFLGGRDALVSLAVLDRFKANMTKAGVRCDTHVYEGQPHGFSNREPFKTATLIETDKFLASIGWLKGEPTPIMPETNPNALAPEKKGTAEDDAAYQFEPLCQE